MSEKHSHTSSSNVFKSGLVLNTGFTIFELAVGTITGSLALIADGTHNLTDSLTLLIAYIAERISKKQADAKRSYGYGRVKIIAALLNAGILLVIATFIGVEAFSRLAEPKEVPGITIALVASVGILLNGGIAYLLSKQRHDLNARSAYTNMLYDTLSSVGALIAGIVIAVSGINWLDSIIGIGIACMLLYATIGIIKDSLHILLEGVPPELDLPKLQADIKKEPAVLEVDDVHAWIIDSGYYAFSCHIAVNEKDLKQSPKLVKNIKQMLHINHKVTHSTIEVELLSTKSNRVHETH